MHIYTLSRIFTSHFLVTFTHQNVLSSKCTFVKMYFRQKVLSSKCTFVKMYFRQNVLLSKLTWMQYHVDKGCINGKGRDVAGAAFYNDVTIVV
jgi:hypothetical protein